MIRAGTNEVQVEKAAIQVRNCGKQDRKLPKASRHQLKIIKMCQCNGDGSWTVRVNEL